MDPHQPAVRTEVDAEGVATLWLDFPGKSVNAFTSELVAELTGAVAALEQGPKPRAVILASAKASNFVAGADLFALSRMDRAQLEQFLVAGQTLCERIERLAAPTVAAINGDCLGGGLELALACTFRVAVDEGRFSLGLPELKLGLLPAWGGTVRLPRLIGLAAALPLMLAGKLLSPRKALEAGAVDQVAPREELLAAARRLALSGQPRHAPEAQEQAAAADPAQRQRVLEEARQQALAITPGQASVAEALLEAVRVSYEQGLAAGFEAERRGLHTLAESPLGRNLLRLFMLRQNAKRQALQGITAPPVTVNEAAVIGAGVMGAGIAHALARAGVAVRLIEADEKALAAGLGRIQRMLDEEMAAGRLEPAEAQATMKRITPAAQWSDLEAADLVIEAVVERLEVKREIFVQLGSLTKPQAVLASNTSALPIAQLAAASAHPQRVVGMHFFNPVPRMPLVEIVRAPQSQESALATAIALAQRLGKTVIRVEDSPGFLVNRVLMPYLAEAVRLASQGAAIPTIDQAMKRWGMPMGPLELLDHIGLDVATAVLRTLASRYPQRVVMPLGLEQALSHGWLGRKSGLGFYAYNPAPARHEPLPPNREWLALLSKGGAPPLSADETTEEAIQWRLILPMVNEAAHALAEGVVHSTEAIDLATVLGLGLAPFRGGLARFADEVGIGEIVRRLEALAAHHGPRFMPAELLHELAAAHRPLADFASAAPAKA